jgi:hypothetical protein
VRIATLAIASIVGQICAGQVRVAVWRLQDAVAR